MSFHYVDSHARFSEAYETTVPDFLHVPETIQNNCSICSRFLKQFENNCSIFCHCFGNNSKQLFDILSLFWKQFNTIFFCIFPNISKQLPKQLQQLQTIAKTIATIANNCKINCMGSGHSREPIVLPRALLRTFNSKRSVGRGI